MIDAALEYASLGWLVLPVVPRDKHRIMATPTRDPDQIRTWWTEMPAANLGVELGAESNVIDIEEDGPRAKDVLQEIFGSIPETTSYRSSRGVHRLFSFSDLPSFTIDELEIRTQGQSVVPPSIHSDGTIYKWLVPPSELLPLPEHAAQWLRNFHATFWHVKALCQPGSSGVCVQCGDPVVGRQTCRASFRGREIRERSIQALSKQPTPCAFLGAPTGNLLKSACNSKPTIVEQFCYHPERMIKSPRSGRLIYAKATPSGTCHDFKAGVDIRPCNQCPLRMPRRLLAAPPDRSGL